MPSLETLRRRAKALRKAVQSGDELAIARVREMLPDAQELKHVDALFVIAREAGHASWPKLKFAFEAAQMDREAKAERLKLALYFGQHWVVDSLLSEVPNLGRDNFGLACALYDIEHVQARLEQQPDIANCTIGIRRPITHLAFSQHIHGAGRESDMLAVAEALFSAGANVNDFHNYNNDPLMPLSCLYGAMGHANNMALARWLLEHGADPNDGESLYHSTELGHQEGLQMLLDHGADPSGTNALPRALDSNDHTAVRLLLNAGADPNEFVADHPSGEPAWVIPALHQAARRMCDAQMMRLLLEAGADPSLRHKGLSPYGIARVYGNTVAADLIADAGGDQSLSEAEQLLAEAADGSLQNKRYLDPAKLPEEYRNLLISLLHLPGKRDHIERLVALGAEWDKPDAMGVTPVQSAGWQGLADIMSYFLRLKPDLSHVNHYGGSLLSTIIHGSENCPERKKRDHLECLKRALNEGVALPRASIELAGNEEVAAFLADWAEAHPGQVVEEEPG